MKPVSDSNAGLVAGIAAFGFWGAFPIYFKIATGVSASEMLAHRILWAIPFGILVLVCRRQVFAAWAVLREPRTLRWLALSAGFIGLNWGVYIYAVQNQQIFQASLGYYINPLLLMLAGGLFLGENLSRWQALAVGLATIGVAILTISGGTFPALALILATSFTVYSMVRKQVAVGAMPGLFAETLLLVPLAIAYLIWLARSGAMIFASGDPSLDWLLVLAGPLTVLPLWFFAIAARQLRLTTIGFLQFIGPTGQFLVGLYYGEALTTAHVVCFGFIWLAVFVFVVDAFRQRSNNQRLTNQS